MRIGVDMSFVRSCDNLIVVVKGMESSGTMTQTGGESKLVHGG